jgi:hypothetical protein
LCADDDNEGLQRYKEAHQILATAFRRCHAGAAKQKQQILQYLAPAAMLCGTLPSTELLHKYRLPQLYVDLVESLRCAQNGNTSGFLAPSFFVLMRWKPTICQDRLGPSRRRKGRL